MNNRSPWGHVSALIIWLILSVAIYLYFDARQQPTIAVASAQLASGEIEIPRSSDGHYYVHGAINGHAVNFMVDTGASTVSISRTLARNVALPAGTPVSLMTASGEVTGALIAGQTIEAGGIVVEGLSVAVGIQGDMALLGQNFLRRVDMLQSDDRMVLRVKK